jgi:hypothetical protein
MSKPTVKIGDTFSTKYGPCEVIDYKNCENVYVKFLKSGGITKTDTTSLRKDSVKDYFYPIVEGKGYFGKGDYKARINGKMTEQYQAWQGMIKRCYNEKSLQKRPSYRECEVCDEWCNYQTFAEWMDTQEYRKKGWQLDKDLIELGNKLYCPDKCIFLPPSINKVLVGVNINSASGIKLTDNNRYYTTISLYNRNTYLGTFDTLEEAKSVYKENKLKYIYKLCNDEHLPQFIIDLFEPFMNEFVKHVKLKSK